jgi:hypothetical protein
MARRLNNVLKDLNDLTQDFIEQAVRAQSDKVKQVVEDDVRNFFRYMLSGIDRESSPTLKGRFGEDFSPDWVKLKLSTRKRKMKLGITSSIGQNKFFRHGGDLQLYFQRAGNVQDIVGRVEVTLSSNVVRTGNNPGQFRAQGIRNTPSASGSRRRGIIPQSEFSTVKMLRARIRLVGGAALGSNAQIDNKFPDDVKKKLKNLDKKGSRGNRDYRPLVGPYLRWYLRKRLPNLIEQRFKDVLVA